MLKIGIIGAGNITKRHISTYKENPECEVVSIADINPEQANKTASEYGIQNVYTDYHDILNDDTIDAVSICTPTFTHKEIVLEAIKANKHILCEKPPALNAEETKEIKKALEGYGKVFQLGFVRRFHPKTIYLKEYIDSGKMGKIICGEVVRIGEMSYAPGWFSNRSLGGGSLRDGAIHELDSILYLMGYPKPKSVCAFESRLYGMLPTKIKSKTDKYPSADKITHIKDTEDVIKAIVNFEDGTSLNIKAGNVYLSYNTGAYYEIIGEKAGVMVETFGSEQSLKVKEITDNMYLTDTVPSLPEATAFSDQITHFVDCINGRAKCVTDIDEAVALMEIIDAVYKSAETGTPINF